MIARLVAGALLAFVLAAPALAHKASDSFLTLDFAGERATARWDIALRDASLALDLDADGDGSITWGELRARERDLAAWALPRLAVSRGSEACSFALDRLAVDAHSDGAYAVLELGGDCPAQGPAIRVDYRLLFDLDPQHRGLVRVIDAGGETATIMTAETRTRTIAAGGGAAQARAYFLEGVTHIWGGIDHLLFLVSLLLPAVLVRVRRGTTDAWSAAPNFGMSFADVAKIVTAFTLAHSITLTLAALEVVSLPSRPVEAAIALSVVLAALNNLFPVVRHGRWIAAFAFGLIHGFGFAGALAGLGLPSEGLAWSLAAFNLGVEAGQLAIVAVFLPLAFALRDTLAYRRYALGAGSVAIALVGAAWFVERLLDLSLLPWNA